MSWGVAGRTACYVTVSLFHSLAMARAVPESAIGRLQHPVSPFAFEYNQGQAASEAKFLRRTPGYDLFLTTNEAVLVFKERDGNPEGDSIRGTVIRMGFENANAAPVITGVDPLEHRTSYFSGEEALIGIPNYHRVHYAGLYPGIDLYYYGNQGLLEYDLKVAPGGDPGAIKLRFSGMSAIHASPGGELILELPQGSVSFRKPVAFQDVDGQRRGVDVVYDFSSDGRIGFQVGAYDRHKPLVIDPILSYSSFFWARPTGIALDASGNPYIAGLTTATDLPASTGYQTRLVGSQDAYVVKLDPAGTKVIYASYLGVRRATTAANGIAVDGSGNAIIFGTTNSASFPTTAGAMQRTYSAGSSFVTKLNASGNALVYSTFVTGATINAIALDNSGNAVLVGPPGTGFTTTTGAYNSTSGGCMLAKLNAAGSAMIYATYFGGASNRCSGVALDPAGNAYLSGTASASDLPVLNAAQSSSRGKSEAFAAKLNATGSALLYATYLGGTEDDFGNGIAVDSAGQAFVVGRTHSFNFPTTLGSFQPSRGDSKLALSGDRSVISNAFITKLSDTGGTMLYSSYLGGAWCFDATHYSCMDQGEGLGVDAATRVAVDAAGYAYVGGYAASVTFPLIDPLAPVSNGGDNDRAPYVAKVTPLGNRLMYSVVVGSRGWGTSLDGLAVDAKGSAYAIGTNAGVSAGFPLTAGMPLTQSGQSYVFKLSQGRYPTTVYTSSPNAPSSQTVTFTAYVENPVGGGTVSFFDGASSIGSSNVANGTASIGVFMSPGIHRITAVYSVDGKESAPFYQIVTPQ